MKWVKGATLKAKDGLTPDVSAILELVYSSLPTVEEIALATAPLLPEPEKGDKGDIGKTGKTGKQGKQGIPGKDGTELTPLEVVTKIRELIGFEGELAVEDIAGWETFVKKVEKKLNSMTGGVGGVRFLRDLQDVLATSPADGDGLVYDAALGKWKSATAGGGASWGGITGDILDQTDLQTELAGKAALAHAHDAVDVGISATPVNFPTASSTMEDVIAGVDTQFGLTQLKSEKNESDGYAGLQVGLMGDALRLWNNGGTAPYQIDGMHRRAVAPTASEDVDAGYMLDDLWVSIESGNEGIWYCVDNSSGAAVWTRLTGGGGGSAALNTAVLDFGTTGDTFGAFTVTDAAITATSKIGVSLYFHSSLALDRDADEMAVDPVILTAVPASGSMTVYAQAMRGRVVGKYGISYTLG